VQKIVGPFGQLAEVGDGATFEKGFGFWGGEGNNAGFCSLEQQQRLPLRRVL